MVSPLSKRAIAGSGVLFFASLPAVTFAVNVRLVTYNTQGDTGISNNSLLPNLATVIEGIGQQQYVGDNILRLADIVALQETTSNSTTVSPLVTDLNSFYGSSVYSFSSYQATQSGGNTSGNGPNALIYNQTTMNLMASVGVGTPGGSSNGEYRQVVRYQFQPIADKGTSAGVFYVYDSHYKSGSAGTKTGTTTDGALRNEEAQIIRNDEAAHLPASAAVIYVGDYNGDGSSETAYQTLLAANSPSGVNQGQAFDPLNPTNIPNEDWGTSPYVGWMSESVNDLRFRDDLQTMTSNVYNDAANVLGYVANSLHAFGNNGTTALKGNVNTGTNTSLNDIIGHGTLTTGQVLSAMNNTTGSDHLPVVADYSIAILANGIWAGGTGNWSNSALWSNALIPNSSAIEVQIDNSNSIASVVRLDQNATVEDVTVDANDTFILNPSQTLTIAGPNVTVFNGSVTNSGILAVTGGSVTNTGNFTQSTGTLNMAVNFTNSGTATIGGTQTWSPGTIFTNTAGTTTFNTDTGSTIAAPLSINVTGGSVTFASTQHLASLSIGVGASATASLASPHTVIVTNLLTVSGLFNLTNNDLISKNGDLSDIAIKLKSGLNAGGTYWAGATGIESSQAAGDTNFLTTLGYRQSDGTPFDGVNTTTSDVLVKYTYYGDADLNGVIDGADYAQIDNGFGSKLTGWFNGDFNYDGVVDGTDYSLIDNTFNQISATGAMPFYILATPTNLIAGPATSSVPEPTTFGLIGCGAISLLARRRRVISFR
jgi:hypothetical protein